MRKTFSSTDMFFNYLRSPSLMRRKSHWEILYVVQLKIAIYLPQFRFKLLGESRLESVSQRGLDNSTVKKLTLGSG